MSASQKMAKPERFYYRSLYRNLVSNQLWGRLVRRIQRDHPSISGELARSIMDAALGFLFLCGNYPDRRFAPSRLVDIGWHTFLMYTRDYDSFCKRTVGGKFVHHEPNDLLSGRKFLSSEATVCFMDEAGILYNPKLWAHEVGSCDSCSDSCASCSDGCD